MGQRLLEERLARVERELEQLKSVLSRRSRTPWWRQIVGDFEGDRAFAEIVRLGRRLRRADRKDAR